MQTLERRFKNGGYLVDFVLVSHKEGKPDHIAKRNEYEANLTAVGLLLEKEEYQHLHFVKVHVPTEVVSQYSEILKLRLPTIYDEDLIHTRNLFWSTVDKVLRFLHVKLDPKTFPPKNYKLTAEFSSKKDYLFDLSAPDELFNESVRINVAAYILEREKFGTSDQEKGIRRLISENVYKAAYPLHDGGPHDKNSKRCLLLHEWAQISKCAKYQPIDDVREYFGAKIALYFIWLGFYTHMLIPAALVGILCIIYAATTLSSDTIASDICNSDIIMCPRCDKVCDYWKLSDGCLYSKIQHFVDNPATIFFSVFMSFWSVLYLELWKRYSAEIAHKWGLAELELRAEPPRPEYLIRLHGKKEEENVITQEKEPVVSFLKMKLPSIILSFAVALVWVFIALSVMFGVVIYRMSLLTSEALYDDATSYRIYVLPVTAAIINLVCISILNLLYQRLAVWLTELELQRTQTEYDDSLALKIYMFQFVNYYSSIFYIAFLKGQFVGYPAKYNRIFGFRQEECDPGGCLMELTIQLVIIMVGKQALNAVTEIGVPILLNMYNSARMKMGFQQSESDEVDFDINNQWTQDYKLSDFQSQSLFSEYLEMVLQYGFVTIFVTAFPLAPLFALINNILEMRLDAKKFIKYYRRPVPQRVKTIGIWYPILAIIGRVSVVSNAFIIAFNSHFIPKLVYVLEVSLTHTEDGFLENSLAYFDTADFESGIAPENPSYNVSICRYNSYRNPPNVTGDLVKYKRPIIYWHILAAQLAFMVAYQNVMTFVVTAVEWTIPDIPRRVNDQIKREAHFINEKIIAEERRKARLELKKRKKEITKFHTLNDSQSSDNHHQDQQ